MYIMTGRSKPHVERHARRLRKFQDIFEGKAGGAADAGGDDDAEKRADHHASTVADLLVEAKSHPDRSAALSYLLHSPHGQALLARMHKAADQTEKESTMRSSETLEGILKDCGPIRLCKGICERRRSPCTEAELVALITKHVGGTGAFAKLCEGAEGNVVMRAFAIAKANEFASLVLDYEPHFVGSEAWRPRVIGGKDAYDAVVDPEAALTELHEFGHKLYPHLPDNIAFARVFEDPKFSELAARAHQRPAPTTVYAMPHTSRDPV
jgi:hypothetical protein